MQLAIYANWQLQPQINWIGSRTSPQGDNRALDDYETIDLTLRGKKLYGQLNLAASLRNAFDTNYYEPAAISIAGKICLCREEAFTLKHRLIFDVSISAI